MDGQRLVLSASATEVFFSTYWRFTSQIIIIIIIIIIITCRQELLWALTHLMSIS